MKKAFCIFLMVVLASGLTSFSAHKFYVAIYQLHFNKERKRLEITSRIFVDDLNRALEKKYGRAVHLGGNEESANDVSLMKKYISDNLVLKINGKQSPFEFLSKEMENNVLICYFKSRDITGIKVLDVSNKILFDFVTEQQNIIQTAIYGKKNSLLLTVEEPSGQITF